MPTPKRTFRQLHRYVLDSLVLASLLLAAVVILAWDLHGAVSFIRWMWAR
jgi:hypothetical protein